MPGVIYFAYVLMFYGRRGLSEEKLREGVKDDENYEQRQLCFDVASETEKKN